MSTRQQLQEMYDWGPAVMLHHADQRADCVATQPGVSGKGHLSDGEADSGRRKTLLQGGRK